MSRICELSNWFFSHGASRRVTVFSHEFSFCPELLNLRIGLFSHGASRRVTGFCHELSNCRIGFFSHGASRMVTVLLSRDLSFGPTDQREVICELVFLHTECHGWSRSFHTSSLFVPNYRICELSIFYSHGMSRMVTAFLSRDLSFGSTDQREVICELSNFSSHGLSRIVVEVMRVEL